MRGPGIGHSDIYFQVKSVSNLICLATMRTSVTRQYANVIQNGYVNASQ